MADMVNHPPHYNFGPHETIDVIEAWDLPYHLGNVVKYVSRAKRKGKELEDLKKAAWYLERYISLVEKEVATSADSNSPFAKSVKKKKKICTCESCTNPTWYVMD